MGSTHRRRKGEGIVQSVCLIVFPIAIAMDTKAVGATFQF